MSFFRQYIAPLFVVLIFLVALLAVSARIFLPGDMEAAAPIGLVSSHLVSSQGLGRSLMFPGGRSAIALLTEPEPASMNRLDRGINPVSQVSEVSPVEVSQVRANLTVSASARPDSLPLPPNLTSPEAVAGATAATASQSDAGLAVAPTPNSHLEPLANLPPSLMVLVKGSAPEDELSADL